MILNGYDSETCWAVNCQPNFLSDMYQVDKFIPGYKKFKNLTIKTQVRFSVSLIQYQIKDIKTVGSETLLSYQMSSYLALRIQSKEDGSLTVTIPVGYFC